MESVKYKFIDYSKDFPAHLSVQSGRNNLVAPHYHEDAEIIMITDGKVDVGVGTENIKCYKGDILVLYPNTLHRINALTENAEITALLYKTDIVGFAGSFLPKRGGYSLFEEKHPIYSRLKGIFCDAVGLFSEKSNTFGIEMTACLLNLSAVYIKENIMVSADRRLGQSRLQPAFLYIEENLGSVIKIADLERVLNLSKEHIIRLFKSETGKTPAEYVIDLKIKTAMEMLKSDKTSITEIAVGLGFSSPSHLSKSFKERLKMTPSEYKKEALRR